MAASSAIQIPDAQAVTVHYLILAHIHPGQLRRLIDRLDDTGVRFYVHVDLKADLDAFKNAIPQQNVIWISNRVNCLWGDISLVRATLLLIRAALERGGENGMCVLLSGQDYPVKSREYIRHFFSLHRTTIFLDSQPAKQVWPDFYRRITYYKLQHSEEKLDYTLFYNWDWRAYVKLLLKGKLTCLADRRIWRRRALPLPLDFYGGSQWWAMPLSVLQRVDDFIGRNEKELFDFFQDSLIPDEFFFQSILALPEISADHPIASPVTYVKWDGKKHPQPVVFRLDDGRELLALPDFLLFARKFNVGLDEDILNLLDENLQG